MSTVPGILPLSEVEKEAIIAAITRLDYDIPRAAAALKIGKTTLYNKLKGYGLRVIRNSETGQNRLAAFSEPKVHGVGRRRRKR